MTLAVPLTITLPANIAPFTYWYITPPTGQILVFNLGCVADPPWHWLKAPSLYLLSQHITLPAWLLIRRWACRLNIFWGSGLPLVPVSIICSFFIVRLALPIVETYWNHSFILLLPLTMEWQLRTTANAWHNIYLWNTCQWHNNYLWIFWDHIFTHLLIFSLQLIISIYMFISYSIIYCLRPIIWSETTIHLHWLT